MIWIDYAIVGLICISLVIGLVRGFVKEAFSVLLWISAIWIGLNFSQEFSGLLDGYIELPSARLATAFALLLIVTLILGSLIGYLLGELVKKTGLTGSDRFAGMIFGIGRGMLVVAVLVMLAGLTPLPQDPWWEESKLIPPFQSLAIWLQDVFPDEMAHYFQYH